MILVLEGSLLNVCVVMVYMFGKVWVKPFCSRLEGRKESRTKVVVEFLGLEKLHIVCSSREHAVEYVKLWALKYVI